MSTLRDLPSVTQVLAHPQLQGLIATDAVREVLAECRAAFAATQQIPTLDEIAARVQAKIAPKLRPVINATGIVLHTNLGRSPLAEVAAQAAYDAARGYLNLELDLTTGTRSSRQNPVRDDLAWLTGAESATVVNNCAAATVLVLRTLAAGREVIVSRGQLVEIGGSFRIPEIMTASGATLREVGTTNITRLRDYEAAITPNTAMLMRIHTSNFRVSGFTQSVGIEELVTLGRTRNYLVVDDVGSGQAIDLTPWGLPGEPSIREGITAGADLVLFSGDKLLGGPQAGIIAGRKDLIEKLERDPLMRAFRCDKMTLAALAATLPLYRDPACALKLIPTLRMLTTPLAELHARALTLHSHWQDLDVEIREDRAYVGGGSFPEIALPTIVIAVKPHTMSEGTLAEKLRTGTPAILTRVHDGRVLFDLRCVFAADMEALATRVQQLLSEAKR
jgi:L-seryl-tRNA(Ser) seleniumtransferase